MVVAVDKELKAVRNQLLKMGYEVIDPEENVAADAYIYSAKINGGFNNLVKANNDGCLIINADINSMDKILYTLSIEYTHHYFKRKKVEFTFFLLKLIYTYIRKLYSFHTHIYAKGYSVSHTHNKG